MLANNLEESVLANDLEESVLTIDDLEGSVLANDNLEKSNLENDVPLEEEIDTSEAQHLLSIEKLQLYNKEIEKMEPEELERLDELTFAVENNFESYIQDVVQSTEFHKLSGNLQKIKDFLSKESRTAKLWIQYMHYIQVLKDFVRAERTGNWSLHLHTVGKMLNLFAATDHIHYAKSSQLYL